MKKEDEKITKQPYETPILRKVELKTDEVLVSGCKTGADAAPSATCDNAVAACFADGS